MKQVAAKKRFLSVNTMAKIGLLAAVAGVLMLFEFPLWFAPPFYKLDLSEVPVLVGALALGPMAGVIIELVKIMINFVLNGTITGGVGEAANLIVGCAFILPIAMVYSKEKNHKGMFKGFVLGILALGVVGAIINYYVLLPVYAVVFGMPLDAFIQMGNALNPAIVDLKTFILWAVVPFNLLKGSLISLLTFFLYRRLSRRLEK